MKPSDRALAGRYGKALFLAAEGVRAEEQILKDITEAHRTLSQPQQAAYLSSPRVSSADKKARLKKVLTGKLHEFTVRFLDLLIDKKRFDLLPLMPEQLTRFIDEKKNKGVAKVHTAVALSAQDQEILKTRLKAFSGKNEIELDIKEDSEIIGGLVVRLDDWVIDASLRGQLARLKEAFNGN